MTQRQVLGYPLGSSDAVNVAFGEDLLELRKLLKKKQPVILALRQKLMKWSTKKEPEEVKSKDESSGGTWIGFQFQPLLHYPQTHPGAAK